MVKNLPASARDARDMDSIPGSGRSPRVGNGNPLQYSSLGNPMDRGAWQATYSSWGHKESDVTEVTEHTHVCVSRNKANPAELVLCSISTIPVETKVMCP